jgi:hypothetical protein
MNPLQIATVGKGPSGMLKRAAVISGRYGLTSANMDRILAKFTRTLDQFGCGATFPITGVSLARNKKTIEQYKSRNIEFAVHGFFHVDHTQLSLSEHLRHLEMARREFNKSDISCKGFRCPYLRWNEDTLAALKQSGFLYDSSQALAWDGLEVAETETYRHVLGFYGAISARDYPSLPRLENGLARIPYCLPDDEAFVDRLHLTAEPMIELWLAILARTYADGELFSLGLHPERFELCEKALVETLRHARGLTPGVWIARLDEVASWWLDRAEAKVSVNEGEGNRIFIRVYGPQNVNILARGVNALSPTVGWDNHYQRALTTEFGFVAERRPFIGISSSSSPNINGFLRQLGYIVEQADDNRTHAFYIDQIDFDYRDERPLLARIEKSDFPLVKLGRWPGGARSALCITGDIDALTIWDYGLRLLER